MHLIIPGLQIELTPFDGNLDSPELGGPGIIALVEKTTDRIEIIQASWLRLRLYRLLKDTMFTSIIVSLYPDNPLDHVEIHYASTNARKRVVRDALIGRWMDRTGEIKRAREIVGALRRLGVNYEDQLLAELGYEQLKTIKEVSERSFDDA